MSRRYKKPPVRLFKYVSAERAAQILRDRTIRFTQPAVLNDPFEFCPSLDLEALKNDFLSSEEVRQRVDAGEDRKTTMRGFYDFCSGVAYSYGQSNAAIGVLSLGERCDIPLMWSHYADQHRGIVIGFDVSKGMFKETPFPRDDHELSECRPVIYSKERHHIPSPHDPRGHMFTKDICWAYEKEWRVVRGLRTLQEVSQGIYVGSFPEDAVTCVIYGALTPPEAVTTVQDQLRKGYKGVHTYAADLNSHDFEMDLDTAIGRALENQDLALEEASNPGVRDLYRFTSKGELFRAMEVIPADTVFRPAKDQLGF